MALALIHQYQFPEHRQEASQNIDAPTPWRAVSGYSEIAAILDANGHTVTLARREVAARIVAAVNAVERAL